MIVSYGGKRFFDKSSAARHVKKSRVTFKEKYEPFLKTSYVPGYLRVFYSEEELENFKGPQVVKEDEK